MSGDLQHLEYVMRTKCDTRRTNSIHSNFCINWNIEGILTQEFNTYNTHSQTYYCEIVNNFQNKRIVFVLNRLKFFFWIKMFHPQILCRAIFFQSYLCVNCNVISGIKFADNMKSSSSDNNCSFILFCYAYVLFIPP